MNLMKTVLITGANSGIGRATALALAAAEYRVFAAMRSLGKADKLLSLATEAASPPVCCQFDASAGNDASVHSNAIAT